MTDTSTAWAPAIPEELADVVTLPRHCPSCNYSLEGLPRNHRCPECGEPYDASMREITMVLPAGRRRIAVPLEVVFTGGLLWEWTGGLLGVVPVYLWLSSLLVIGLVCASRVTSDTYRWFLSSGGIADLAMGHRDEVAWPKVLTIRVKWRRLYRPNIIVRSRLVGKRIQTENRLPVCTDRTTTNMLRDFICDYADRAKEHMGQE